MFFHLTELEHHPVRFDVTYAPGEIVFDDELKQVGDLTAIGQTELLKNTEGEIRIRGHVKVTMHAACDRCLEPAAVPIDDPFDLFYRPEPEFEGHPEIRIEAGEEELSFYEGDGVQLEEVLREFILLQIPMQHFCRPDCKGICPHCGQNRNELECACDNRKIDDRWAALRNL
jgi:uncharacterized protein